MLHTEALSACAREDIPAGESAIAAAPSDGEHHRGVLWTVVELMLGRTAVRQRPRAAAAFAAIIVLMGFGAIMGLGAFVSEETTNRHGPTTESGPAGSPAGLHQALTYASNLPPAQLIPAAQGEEPCRDTCAGQRFDLVFGRPWLVTQVGFRPLELIPGRRVTKLRWELNDPDRTVFLQGADDPAGGYALWSLALGERSYRTTSITATVLDTVPAPDARPSASPAGRSPLVAYGNRTSDPADTQSSGFARPAEANLNDYGSVAQQQGSSALTVRFPRPITLTSIVIGPKAGG
ncbi:hypothetical protein [Mycolicibacterium llatzerense]|uniref:hypothetical protein n=1 Tax=Mycolicibacterium llatzerense TaxID=280871 RepID=UPI0013A6C40F|nr:hypothetical protein [Mycolicibacterium llatzerense]